jgi:hypothetical protein
VTGASQTEDKQIIEQPFFDAAHAIGSLKSSNVQTSASIPVTFATGASSSSTPAAAFGAMQFTEAMYDDIDASISSIKKVASEQLFVSGRVDLWWKQVEANTNVVQVHEAGIQALQAASVTNTYAPCQQCGVSGAMGVQTDDGSSMPKPTGGDGDGSIASTVLKVIGGNGQCHCVHVTELQKKVEVIEKDLNALKSEEHADACRGGSFRSIRSMEQPPANRP